MPGTEFETENKGRMSATAGIRTRVASLEGLNPNQLDYSCNRDE